MDLRQLVISDDMQHIIDEVDEFKSYWHEVQDQIPECLLPQLNRETVFGTDSSNTVQETTHSDVKSYDGRIECNMQNIGSHYVLEDKGYIETLRTVNESSKLFSLSEEFIKGLHNEMLRYSTKDQQHRGKYKTCANDVVTHDSEGYQLVILEATLPEDTPREMAQLVNWAHNSFEPKRFQNMHPLLVIGVFNVIFLAIHPFKDGNGRLSRLLTTFMLIRSGYEFVKFTPLEKWINISKLDYANALYRTQSSLKTDKHQWDRWLVYFLTVLKRQKDYILSRTQEILSAGQNTQ